MKRFLLHIIRATCLLLEGITASGSWCCWSGSASAWNISPTWSSSNWHRTKVASYGALPGKSELLHLPGLLAQQAAGGGGDLAQVGEEAQECISASPHVNNFLAATSQ